MKLRNPPLPALTVKLSKYNVDDVALGVCKTGAEEAGVTEVRTSLSEKKFELWREIKVYADGWFIVFDTLTLADDRLEAFYDNPNALRDYFRDIGRMVLAAEGRKANDSHADCYQYFCVPEYGTANGRLHFHAVHFMRTLPTGSVDPNF